MDQSREAMNAKRSQNFGAEKSGLVFLKPLESRWGDVWDWGFSTFAGSAVRRGSTEDMTSWLKLLTVKGSGFDNVSGGDSEHPPTPLIESTTTHQMICEGFINCSKALKKLRMSGQVVESQTDPRR